MREYTFVPMGRTPQGIVQRMAEPKTIEAMSLKKQLKNTLFQQSSVHLL